MTTDDRRRFQRITFDAQVQLFDATHAWPTTLIDISLNGALVTRPEDWAGRVGAGQRLEVRLESGARITMGTTVASILDDRLGLHCERIDMESFSQLKRLVELNLGDHSLLYRELEALG